MGPVERRIREKLQIEFSPIHLELENESHAHSVPKGSETHFRLVLVSEKFSGLNRVARSRLVHQTLAAELAAGGSGGGVHALTQKTLTPAEWEALGGQVEMVSPPCHGGSKADH